MTKQHIAQSGQKKGEYVACPAKNCTIGSESEHVDTTVLKSAQNWLKDNGINKRMSDIRPSHIAIFKAIPEETQAEYISAQEEFDKARLERLNSVLAEATAGSKPKANKGLEKQDMLAAIASLRDQNKAAAEKKKASHQPTYGNATITEDGFVVIERSYSNAEIDDINTCLDAYGKLFDGEISAEQTAEIIRSRSHLAASDKQRLVRSAMEVKTHENKWSANDLEFYSKNLSFLRKDVEQKVELGTNASYYLYAKGYEVAPVGPKLNAPVMKKSFSFRKESPESLRAKLDAYLNA